ncbi:substrate-binding periplasmic protein [Roseibium sp.]|uniref:substrate-binding periplasmic protein n=1 Tax=Roseibium sp. TaxID=1936156 RepID=UPI003D123DDB
MLAGAMKAFAGRLILRVDAILPVLRVSCLLLGLLGLAAVYSGPVAAQELRLITSPWPPSNFLDTDGQPTGISVATVEALKRHVGVTTPIEVLPFARGYLIAQSTPNVMLFTGGRTEERIAMGFQFIGPAVMWTHVLLARKESPLKLPDLASVRVQGLTVAGVRSSWQIELIKAAGIPTVETEDHATGARMLLAGRVDLWITSRLQASVVLTGIGQRPDAVEAKYTVRKSPSYLMISRGTDPALLARWQAAFKDLQATGFFRQTAVTWGKRLGLPLAHDPDQGFYVPLSGRDPAS